MATTWGSRAANLADTGAINPGWVTFCYRRAGQRLHAKSCERFVSGAKSAGGTENAYAATLVRGVNGTPPRWRPSAPDRRGGRAPRFGALCIAAEEPQPGDALRPNTG